MTKYLVKRKSVVTDVVVLMALLVGAKVPGLSIHDLAHAEQSDHKSGACMRTGVPIMP